MAAGPRRNVAGFQETLATAVQMSIHESLAVPVASVPGLAPLKLVAWLDRGHSTDKDAADFYRLLSTYSDAGNIDRLYDEEMPLLEAADFDLKLAGAELLGRDVIQPSFPLARDSLDRIFNKPESLERLLAQMERLVFAPEYTAHVDRLVQTFQRGLRRR